MYPVGIWALVPSVIEGPLAVPSRSVGVSVGSRPGLGFVMVDRVLCGGSRTGLVLLIVRCGHERPLCGGVSAVLSWSYRALIKRSGTSGPGVFLFSSGEVIAVSGASRFHRAPLRPLATVSSPYQFGGRGILMCVMSRQQYHCVPIRPVRPEFLQDGRSRALSE